MTIYSKYNNCSKYNSAQRSSTVDWLVLTVNSEYKPKFH